MVRYDFSGKVALVTGGTDGIGLAAVRGFLAAGARVMMVGRDPARGARALDSLGGEETGVLYRPVDVADEAQVKAMVEECVRHFGGLDFAVNNAAAEFPLVPTADIPLEAVDRSLAVDLRGCWLCMREEIRHMQAHGGGAIVNVSSVNGFAASPLAGIYSATKHGMNGLSAAAAREYARQGIRVNTVCPGAIETPRRQRRLTGKTAEEIEAHYADLAQRVPLGRVGTAEEVAAGILWLCTPESAYVVGADLVIDGGLSA